MKLGSVKVKDTAVIEELYYPNGDVIIDEDTGNPVTIEILSPDSDRYREIIARRSRDQAAKSRNKPKRAKNSGVTKQELDDAIDLTISLLAEITVSWTGITDEDGKPLECNADNAFKLYSELPFIKRQVEEAHNDASLFFEK